MKTKRNFPRGRVLGLAGLILTAGILGCVWLTITSGLVRYPAQIAGIYREKQHRLGVPGAKEVKLMRTGAYGIYYEHNFVSAAVTEGVQLPPEIECKLAGQTDGREITAVPDYVATNRYWSMETGGPGVLIMSLTVEEPGAYSFTCQYQDGRTEPEIMVALGPNYVWGFLKATWETLLPLVGAMAILEVSLLACGGLIVLEIGRRRKNPKEPIIPDSGCQVEECKIGSIE